MLAHHHYLGDLLLKEDSKLEGVHVLSLVQKENIIYTSPVLEVRMGMLEWLTLRLELNFLWTIFQTLAVYSTKTIYLACELIFRAVHNPHSFLLIV